MRSSPTAIGRQSHALAHPSPALTPRSILPVGYARSSIKDGSLPWAGIRWTVCRFQEPLHASGSSAAGVALPLGLPGLEAVERVTVTPVFRAAPWDAERLRRQQEDPVASILLVSESGVCRSVLAAAALTAAVEAEPALRGRVRVDCCATRPYNLGEGPEPAAAQAAAALGLALPPNHAARLFAPAADIVDHDLLLVMDKFTAGDVMREVSSFDLVSRDTQLSHKVRRLGEFRPVAGGGSGGLIGSPSASTGDDGSAGDIEDPLYGNVGGQEEQDAVFAAARAIVSCCRGVVALLLELEAEIEAQGLPSASASEEEEEYDAGACELPLPGQAPVCSGGSVDGQEEEAEVAGEERGAHGGDGGGGGGRGPSLGAALRARVAALGPAAWLAPPMLSPRSRVDDYE